MVANPIWQPKFSTGEVLVARTDVRPGKNYIFFVADRNHLDLYSYDGDRVKKEGKVCSNGTITCIAFPLDWLDNEGELPEVLVQAREKEYKKFKRYQAKK